MKKIPPQSGFGLNNSPEAESAARLQWDGKRYTYGAIYRDITRPLIPLNPLAQDQRTVAERRWRDRLKPAAPQQPCDHGLFSDEHLQLELVEMFQDPTNEE